MEKRTRNTISERVELAKKAKKHIECSTSLQSITETKNTIVNYIEKNDAWKSDIDTNKIFIKEDIAEGHFLQDEKNEFLTDVLSYVWIAFSENDGIIQVGKTTVGVDDLFKKITLQVPTEILMRTYGSSSFNNELTALLDKINHLYDKAIIIPVKNRVESFEQEIGDYLLDQNNPIILTHSHSSWRVREHCPTHPTKTM